ncbi:transcriptional regulator family: Helix-turn-helix [Penicillium roqueforti]|nr:transcriptional regulator family: Helix-turn-helix [Penicillium roqueforti]KAI2719712.1 transcriptional regulator family: Helix-turn-helix [Penicillium roqueforti]KAI3153130.1 transcriptional regulator family: Helix-turn-helix [Penicillium roqueforti]KAI3275867.1 transcriptional regulator family: Helix-turn-helix [Penicillium roqueforti]
MAEPPKTPGRPVCVVFGPQSSEIDETLFYISRNIDENPSLGFLKDVLQELPSLWSPITDAWSSLSSIPGATQLTVLAECVQGTTAAPKSAMNVFMTPLTVIRQIIDVWKFKEESQNRCRIVDAQGFCVGFLAAVAVASSNDSNEFEDIASTMIRLAVCIGAAVDLDGILHGPARSVALRWKSDSEKEQLDRVLGSSSTAYISCFTDATSVTVTVAEDEVDDLTKELGGHGLSVKIIDLKGRFHHSRHVTAVQYLADLCETDARFRLARTSPCVLPLRSNVDGHVIGKRFAIHKTALESILTKPSQWAITVSAAFEQARETDDDLAFVVIGTGQFVPRLVRTRVLDHLNNKWSDTKQHAILPNGIHRSSSTTRSRPSIDMAPIGPTVIPIAITGMGCRYAQADSPEQLWEMLELGRCGVNALPNERFKMENLLREPKGPFWGNYLANPDVFDHRFFGISAREAEAMDPQQRLLLQVGYEAMESAGYCGLRTSNIPTDVGCYVGVGSDDYTDNVGSSNANAFSATGTLQAFCTGRLSHYFGWTGPSVVVDTACSSAAVSIHLACKALQTNECSIAVAGGVNVMTSPRVTQNLAAASFLSPTGASKAFDASADGYCRGEGAGLVVLRPLKDAIHNGDPILAIIGGSAVNQGSNRSPITVPDSDSQISLYRKALVTSGVRPEDVTYVEAHGTGTQVGDPIEFESIRKTFGRPARTERLYVGSVKDNIGHTETSSGVAGLLKTVLMMQKHQIPKQANFVQLNPKIPTLDDAAIAIPTKSIHWPSAANSSSTAVAMVTNYGAAGSNAALVVKQYKAKSGLSNPVSPLPSEVPVILAANTVESLRSYCKALLSSVCDAQLTSCQDTAYNLAIKQSRDMDYVSAFSIPVDRPNELIAKLESISRETTNLEKQPAARLPVVLCFGGQNGNEATISEDLFNQCELLQYHLTECEKVCQTLDLPSLFPSIFQPGPIEDTVSLHCILFSIQYASAKSWIDSGLQVDRIIGHSFGQLTGLCVGGGLSLSDALYLVSERAKMIHSMWGSERGAMLLVEGSEVEVQGLLNRAAEHMADVAVDVACVNGPRNTILAGDERSLQMIEKLSAKAPSILRTKRLKNTHAFHSRLVDNIVPPLTKVAQQLQYKPLSIPIEACSQYDDWTYVTPGKIVDHSRRRVDFQTAVERVAQRIQGPAIWLEAGSASPIIPLVRRVIDTVAAFSNGHVYQALDLGGALAHRSLSQATCNLWSRGVKVQFWQFHDSQAKSYNWINLPPYQFAQTRHWIGYDPNAFASLPEVKPTVPSSDAPKEFVQLLTKQPTECVFAINTNDPLYQECTQGHAVLDQNLCPASLYFEIIVRAAGLIRPENDISPAMPHLKDLAISAPLVLNPRGNVMLSLTRARVGDSPWSFSLFTRESNKNKVTTHATGEISLHPFGQNTPLFVRLHSMNRLIDSSRVDSIANSRESSGLKGFAVYQAFRRVVNYADYYRGVEQVFATDHEAAGIVNLPSSRTKDASCDPMLVDNFIQVAGIHVNCLSETKEDEVFVCTGVGEILIGEAFMTRDPNCSRSWAVYSNVDRSIKNKITCDTFVLDRETDKLAVTILSATFTSVSIAGLSRVLKKLNNQPDDKKVPLGQSLRDDSKVALNPTPQNALAAVPAPLHSAPDSGHFMVVQEMLCDLLGIASDELLPSSNLEDIGVDSLMRTEVLVEIKKRFNFTIDTSSFVEIPDILTLVQTIFPDAATAPLTNGVHPSLQIETTEAVDSESNTHVIPTPISDEEIHGLIDIAPGLFTDIQRSMVHSQSTQWDGFCESVYPRQMALVTAYVVEAFKSLGVSLESFEAEHLIPQVPVLQQHSKVRSQLYSILQFSNLIRATDHGFVRTSVPVSTISSDVLHEEIIRLYPQHTSEHNLLRTTGSRLSDCLSGAADPLSLLFQDAEARRLMEDVYTNAPMFKAATNHLAQYLVNLLGRVDTTREIKILEIGGGTGGTTKALLSQLTAVPGLRFQYTFTDLSSGLLTLARKKFKHYSFMKYQVLNIERAPTPDMLGQYDIVLSSNCVHATRSLVQSCSNINKLLRPDGLLCLIELTRNLFWFDLVFGLLEGWWLFEDGRQHALATEHVWKQTLSQSGFQWVDWTYNDSQESNVLRVITASPTSAVILPPSPRSPLYLMNEETIVYGKNDGVELSADIYYPRDLQPIGKPRPIALLIHGGGHIMLSRRDIRSKQVRMLLNAGFLPVSVDYRLCPEVSLTEGPMHDVCDALCWARHVLPSLTLGRPDIQPDGTQAVAVGWSTGAHLAMTLAWTSQQRGIAPPNAILAFYGPTDYEDSFWSQPNFPYGKNAASPEMRYDLWEGIYETPITAYNPPVDQKALGGWMSPADPRSRIALHMNWKGQSLPMLLHGGRFWSDHKDGDCGEELPVPTLEEIQAVSPLAQIRNGHYKTPTFIIHGTLDDLIPVEQAQRTSQELVTKGVEVQLRVVDKAVHLFDIYPGFEKDQAASRAVEDGYEFLRDHVRY